MSKIEKVIQELISLSNNIDKGDKWIRNEIDNIIVLLKEHSDYDRVGDNYLD